MSLQDTCPYCGTKQTLDDDTVGKKARCLVCQRAFVVVRILAPKAPPLGVLVAEAPKRSPAAKLLNGSAEPRKRPEKRSFLATGRSRRFLVWGIGGGLVAAAFVFLTILFFLPSALDRNLTALKGTDPQARDGAVQWFADADPQDADRARVTAALEAILQDGDAARAANGDLVLRAYLRWANQDNLPILIRLVRNPTVPSWSAKKTGLVMEALGKLQDKRAAEALAEKLSDPVLHDRAVAALQFLGAKAEPAVLEYLFDEDAGTRQRANELLVDYGTSARKIVAAAVNRLKSNQPDVRTSAAIWFAENPPQDDTAKTDVARALAGLLDNLSPKVNRQALQALRRWATKDCLPQLLAFSQRELARHGKEADPCDALLIDVLAQFKDATAAEAIALQLKNPPQRDRAVQALLTLGPVATKAVLPYLNHPDAAVQKEARRLCRLLNVSAAQQLAQTLTDLTTGKVGRTCAALHYLTRLRPDEVTLPKVSKALNAPLLDADRRVREDTLEALRVWASKENTAALVALLGKVQSGGMGRERRIIEILAALKDPAAAAALAQGLTDPRECGAVSRALTAIGPAAEDAVIPFLISAERGARFEACRILGAIGTRSSFEPLTRASQQYQGTDPDFVRATGIAFQQIQARK